MALAVFAKAHAGCGAVKVMNLDVVGLVVGHQTCSLARVHEVAGDFGLAIDHHFLSPSQGGQIDAVACAFEKQIKARVHQAFLFEALVHTRLRQHVQGHLLKHTGSNSTQYILWALTLQNDGVDARFVQQLPQQQARRASTHNHHLGSHLFFLNESQVALLAKWILPLT